MNSERWARIGQKVASETSYVNAFEKDYQVSERAARGLVSEAVDKLGISAIDAESIVKSVAPSEVALELARKAESTTVIFDSRVNELIFGQTPARSQLYMESIYGTHENSVSDRESDAGVVSGRRVCEEDGASCDECVAAASDDYVPLDEIADIGSLTCMSNCRCEIIFNYSGVEPLTIDRFIYAPGFANA